MITAITFSNAINRKFLNKQLNPGKCAYGTYYLNDLQNYLHSEVLFMTNAAAFTMALHCNLINPDIKKLAGELMNIDPEYITVNEKTKTSRTYSFAGFTIHEDDKLNPLN